VDFFSRLGEWANANEGILQGMAMLAAALAVVISAAYRGLARRSPAASDVAARTPDASSSSRGPTLLDRPAVAVLPFDDLSENSDQQYLADGLAEELITTLSYWRRFPVIARGATFAYRGRDKDVRKIGHELGARYVLEGSVRREGDRTRVTARLFDAELANQLWTERFERDIDDLFLLQDEISRKIVEGIEPELGRAEMDRAFRTRPESMDGWDACLQAAFHIHHGTREDLAKAEGLLDRALELDPDSPLAHSLNALRCFSESLQGWTADPPRILAKANEAARRAHELAPRDWLSTSLLGITTLWVERNYEEGIALERRALELNPSAASAYQFLGCILQFDGQPRPALEAHTKAQRLNPTLQSAALALSDIAVCHLLMGDDDAAVAMARRAVKSDPSNARARQRLVATLGQAGSEEARAELKILMRDQPGFDIAYVDATYPFRRPEDRDRFVAGLRNAGWSER